MALPNNFVDSETIDNENNFLAIPLFSRLKYSNQGMWEGVDCRYMSKKTSTYTHVDVYCGIWGTFYDQILSLQLVMFVYFFRKYGMRFRETLNPRNNQDFFKKSTALANDLLDSLQTWIEQRTPILWRARIMISKNLISRPSWLSLLKDWVSLRLSVPQSSGTLEKKKLKDIFQRNKPKNILFR